MKRNRYLIAAGALSFLVCALIEAAAPSANDAPNTESTNAYDLSRSSQTELSRLSVDTSRSGLALGGR